MASWYSDNGHTPPRSRSADYWFWVHSLLAIGSALALASPHLLVRAVAAVSTVVNCVAMLRETKW